MSRTSLEMLANYDVSIKTITNIFENQVFAKSDNVIKYFILHICYLISGTVCKVTKTRDELQNLEIFFISYTNRNNIHHIATYSLKHVNLQPLTNIFYFADFLRTKSLPRRSNSIQHPVHFSLRSSIRDHTERQCEYLHISVCL